MLKLPFFISHTGLEFRAETVYITCLSELCKGKRLPLFTTNSYKGKKCLANH